MTRTDSTTTQRRDVRNDGQRGSATGIAIGVLSAILVALAVFVGIKYLGSSDPDPTATAAANPSVQTSTPAADPTSTEPATPEAGPFNGTWVGAIHGDKSAYTAHVVITDDGTMLTGTVAYPEMPCAGDWTQTSRTSTSVNIHEVITSGPKCIDEVDITLSLNPNGTVHMAIFYSDVYLPTGTLTKQN